MKACENYKCSLFSCVSSLFSSGMTHTRSWWVVRRAPIQAFTPDVALTLQDHGRLPVVHTSNHSRKNGAYGAYSQDHGRLPVVHMSKHSRKNLALTLKIAVGCQLRTYPSIHAETCTRVGLLGPRGEQLERASNITSSQSNTVSSTAQKSPRVNTF